MWAEIPSIDYSERLTFDPEEEHFTRSIWSIPGQSPETLVGQAVAFNVVDNETLKKAQADPESYKDLVVRVSGYSAYFVDLGRPVQDDIIARASFDKI